MARRDISAVTYLYKKVNAKSSRKDMVVHLMMQLKRNI